mmetsp:Transcript_66046/g.157937  ORF Transcript_66046/g.157937 Transcript_66046/m.157937 type:complete len:251 (+) Transcript_66046:248-1000(+)
MTAGASMQMTHVPFCWADRSLLRLCSCSWLLLPAEQAFAGIRLCSVISTALFGLTSAIMRSGFPPTPFTLMIRSPFLTSVPEPLEALMAFQSCIKPSRTSLTSKYFAFLHEATVRPKRGGAPVRTVTVKTTSSASSCTSACGKFAKAKSFATLSMAAARAGGNLPYSRAKLSGAQSSTSGPCSTRATRTISLSACSCSAANSMASPSHFTAASTTSRRARKVSEANCNAKPSLATATITTSLLARKFSAA